MKIQKTVVMDSVLGQYFEKGKTRINKVLRFFPQIKVEGQWIFMYPLNRKNGYKTIEQCETIITSLENTDNELNIGPFEYRIKEEAV